MDVSRQRGGSRQHGLLGAMAGSTCSTGGRAGAEAGDDLLARHFGTEPAGDSEPVAEVDEVSPHTTAFGPRPRAPCRWLAAGKRLDPEGQPIARRVDATHLLSGAEPDEVGAPSGLLGGDAELVHEVSRRIGRRRVHRHTEALDQALRVAFVPRRGEHDPRLALRRELEELVRHGQRVEEEQPGAVVYRVGGHLLRPRLARRPPRVRRLPVPKSGL